MRDANHLQFISQIYSAISAMQQTQSTSIMACTQCPDRARKTEWSRLVKRHVEEIELHSVTRECSFSKAINSHWMKFTRYTSPTTALQRAQPVPCRDANVVPKIYDHDNRVKLIGELFHSDFRDYYSPLDRTAIITKEETCTINRR